MMRAIVWLTLMIATACVGSAAERPNIVFILADDLGINDLSCYGRKDQATPNLDALAAGGIRFTAGYCAQPICSPSRAAIMTGKHPARLHITTFLPGRADAPSQKLLHPKIAMQLPLEEQTLAERLKAAGYATACIGKWHLGGVAFGPDKQGFDFVYAGRANTTPSANEGGKGEYDLTAQAVKFIEEHKQGPFFLYLPHNTPHIPLAARTDLVERYRDSFNPVYAALIESMDDTVGIILAKLESLGLEENTIVVFTSDNGGLHVLESPQSPATHNTPYRAGKGYLYEGGLRVPTIIRWPGKIKPAVVDEPIVNTDWLPTLLSLAGVPLEDKLDGVDQSAALLGKADFASRTFFWHFPHYNNQGGRPAGAVRDGNWKMIQYYDTDAVELFDLASDVSEQHDLAPQQPDRAAKMRDELKAWRKQIGAQENHPNPAFQPELFHKLYVDVDPSRPELLPTSAAMAEVMQPWRKLMNEMVRKN